MPEPTTPPGPLPGSPEGTPSGASERPAKSRGSYGSDGRGSAAGSRTRVALACGACESRNYQTTRKTERVGQLSLKKFCPSCNKHTLHKETK